MADVNRGNRPLSPFMIGSVYRPQITSVMSILHRLTGIGIGLTGVLVVWWFLAASTSPYYFDFADGLLTSWIGNLILFLALVSLWYHFFNGIRHLFWDAGKGFELGQVRTTGIATAVAAGVMSIVTITIALWG
ncbi:succinate dehydrogenase / fumarate reductase cytochrome b subunit [Amaricoccus macauensis]|uniref:Succinate dehydrogenase cytochrome b556 subunit n=1 Tax=Amaricoccus macauensis TaxID=57001 RepID=A0A840SLL7_9RHOB|nr:succinate dehydrogenase, cytochrome b556 subunit [Amaricoccus macauensis]MBB5220766.1 succinate dehydrogenase / fumarate reductase cytochrome b subunit [Amaricoccus macauensis]